MLTLTTTLVQTFCIPGVWRLRGAVGDEAGKMVRDRVVGAWWARLGSMDQKQGDGPRGRAGLQGALEFKSWCPKGTAFLGLIWAALVSEGHRMS